MKKSLKITLIILIFLVSIILLDIIQAKIFNNTSLLKVLLKEEHQEKIERNDKMENVTNINVIINNKKYNAQLEANKTVNEFLNLLPQEFNMQELNGNEKYVYMNYELSSNSSHIKTIKAGDIMLYGNNCLVIFYKTFEKKKYLKKQKLI